MKKTVLAVIDLDDMEMGSKLKPIFQKPWYNAKKSKKNIRLQLDLYKEYVQNRSIILFAGIVIVISGDGFQLPVVQDKCILSDASRIMGDDVLYEMHSHFNIGAIFLELKESVRHSSCTYNDAN